MTPSTAVNAMDDATSPGHNSIVFKEGVSWTRQKNTIKFGGQYQRTMDHIKTITTQGNGLYNFTSLQNFLQAKPMSLTINLPNGATVTKVSVWYTAAAVAGSLNFGGLVRHAVADGNTHYLAEADLGPTANKRVAAALKLYPQPALVPTTLKIDNARFSYAFAVCLVGQSKAAFHAARIIYTYLD